MTKYVVVADGVGPWVRGDEVGDTDLNPVYGVERLLALGSIAPAGSKEAKDDLEEVSTGVLPIHPENPAPDVVRIDQPTLPQAGVTPPDSAPQEVKDTTEDLTKEAAASDKADAKKK